VLVERILVGLDEQAEDVEIVLFLGGEVAAVDEALDDLDRPAVPGVVPDRAGTRGASRGSGRKARRSWKSAVV
jgi:hypothetical protein